MKETLSTFSFHRQTHLRNQIIQASKLNEESLLLTLQSQWVHRFGIESLPVLPHSQVSLGEDCLSKHFDQTMLSDDQCLKDEAWLNHEDGLAEVKPCKDSIGEVSSKAIDGDYDYLNEVDNLLEDEVNEVDLVANNNPNKIQPLNRPVIPPPPPTLKHLRRWLPGVVGNQPKAS